MIKRIVAVVVLSLLTVRCATVAHGRGQRIHVTSSPAGASVVVNCGDSPRDAGATPVDVIVRRSAEHCELTLMKPGFAARTITMTRIHSKLVWLNLVPGFVVGAAAGAGAAVGSLMDESGSGNEGNAAFGAGLAAGTGLGLVVDHATGGWYRQVPAQIDATLDPQKQ